MIDYQIAIPSYKRPTRLITETLTTLKRTNADFSRVTIFVADSNEKHLYDTALQAIGLGVKVVISQPGLINSRIWYNLHYYKPAHASSTWMTTLLGCTSKTAMPCRRTPRP